MKDKLGKEYKVGDTVIRAQRHGSSSAFLYFANVTRIENDKMYLDNSHVPIKFPNAMIIWDSK